MLAEILLLSLILIVSITTRFPRYLPILLDYTMIYEHNNAQGRALAIVNNGKYLNLTDVSMGDGERTWNDQVSSATVKAN